MTNDDRSSDNRLRQSAHASLIRFEDEVDADAALADFGHRLAVQAAMTTAATRPDRARGTRRVLAVVGATTLVVGGIATLAWPDNSSQLATTSPDTIGTTAGSTPSTSQTAVSSTSPTMEIPTTSAPPSLAPRELVDLTGRTWVITEVDGQPRPFVAHFEMSSGSITGHDGCNRYEADVQVTAIVDGEASIQLGDSISTAMGCPPSWGDGWSAPNGRYRVDGNALTITATDGHTYEAVDLEALEMINSPEQIVGVWTVPSGGDIEFVDDGVIRLPCAAIGTWTFDAGLRVDIDDTADTSGCGDFGPESVGPTYEALVSTSPVIRILPDGSLLVGSWAFGRLFPSSSGEAATIDSELGRVSYTLPPGSSANPTQGTQLPDFVVGQARWIVSACCNLTVTLQNLEPPMPDRELTDSFDANGIHWNLYDSGPRDGTLIIARGTAGPITVLVATQGLGGDPPGPSTLPVAQAVVRTVVVDPNGAS